MPTFSRPAHSQNIEHINDELRQAQAELVSLENEAAAYARRAHSESASLRLRRQIEATEITLSDQERQLNAVRKNLDELTDLKETLSIQSQRFIRAIVADEWLVDFDFVVCPRCGTEVDSNRATVEMCYLCGQPPQKGDFQAELIKEQERIASQIVETSDLLGARALEIAHLQAEIDQTREQLSLLNRDLDLRTAEFVSTHSDTIASQAAAQARLREQLMRLREYRELITQFDDLVSLRARLDEQRSDLSDALNRREKRSEEAEQMIRRLEMRFQNYLERLHVSLSDLPLDSTISRTTYLPEISGRPFDTLSSQGLSVLVNVAHALAHHTVSIDEGLPLPDLLVLDGLSSNVGHEGFDLARRDDTYRLLMEETQRYAGRLQVIALDNDVPQFGRDSVVMTLSTADRLVRPGGTI